MSEFDIPEIFRTVLESLHTGVYLVDRYLRIIFWNDGAEKITGYMSQDVLGAFCRDQLLASDERTRNVLSDAAAGLSEVLRGGKAKLAGKTIVGSAPSSSIVPTQNMEQLKTQLEKAISGVPNFDKLKSHIEMTITPEGLRIELIEGASGTFFESGSPNLNIDGQDLLKALAGELEKLPNKISVEGHTDAKPYATGGNYGNCELSADRANAARRLIQGNGVEDDQVTQVRGYAPMQLRNTKDPLDPANRRISLIVHYLDTGNGAEAAGTGTADASSAGASSPPPLSLPGAQPAK